MQFCAAQHDHYHNPRVGQGSTALAARGIQYASKVRPTSNIKYAADGTIWQKKKFALNIRHGRTHFFYWVLPKRNNSRVEGPMFVRYFMCHFKDRKFSVR